MKGLLDQRLIKYMFPLLDLMIQCFADCCIMLLDRLGCQKSGLGLYNHLTVYPLLVGMVGFSWFSGLSLTFMDNAIGHCTTSLSCLFISFDAFVTVI